MSLLDLALAPLRAVLGSAERETESVLPIKEIEKIQTDVLSTAESIRRATESIEAHVAVIETLATSVAPLTQAVAQLTEQLAQINAALAPLENAERDLSRLEHLFGRHRGGEAPSPKRPPR